MRLLGYVKIGLLPVIVGLVLATSSVLLTTESVEAKKAMKVRTTTKSTCVGEQPRIKVRVRDTGKLTVKNKTNGMFTARKFKVTKGVYYFDLTLSNKPSSLGETVTESYVVKFKQHGKIVSKRQITFNTSYCVDVRSAPTSATAEIRY